MGRVRSFFIVLLVSMVVGLNGCAGPRLWARPVEPLRSDVGVVFLVHGIWPDDTERWLPEVEHALARLGVPSIRVGYRTFVLGYLTGAGTAPPTDRIVVFAGRLKALHKRTGCRVPLRFHGVGFSAGTRVLLDAARQGVRFERVFFGGSPVFAFSGDLEDALTAGQIQRLVNYTSPLDGVVWTLLGAGQLGVHLGDSPASAQVENRLDAHIHPNPLFGSATGPTERVARELAAVSHGTRHTCFEDLAYTRWYLAARAALEHARPIPPLPPANQASQPNHARPILSERAAKPQAGRRTRPPSPDPAPPPSFPQ